MEIPKCFVLLVFAVMHSTLGKPSIQINVRSDLSSEQQWKYFKSAHTKYYSNPSEEIGKMKVIFMYTIYNSEIIF